MIELTLLFSTFLATTSSLAGDKPKDLVGEVHRSDLEKVEFPWVKTGEIQAAEKFRKNPDSVRKLAPLLRDIDIEVYFGTWCGDSHDHVPPFLAMLDEAKALGGGAPKSMKLFARGREKTDGSYGTSRIIQRLPTFIYLRSGKEIGRITETPVVSVLDDTLGILTPKN